MQVIRTIGHVTLPSKIGTVISFTAHDLDFRCARLRTDCWSLSAPQHTVRVRFGNAAEIAKDIGIVLETGVLPGKAGAP